MQTHAEAACSTEAHGAARRAGKAVEAGARLQRIERGAIPLARVETSAPKWISWLVLALDRILSKNRYSRAEAGDRKCRNRAGAGGCGSSVRGGSGWRCGGSSCARIRGWSRILCVQQRQGCDADQERQAPHGNLARPRPPHRDASNGTAELKRSESNALAHRHHHLTEHSLDWPGAPASIDPEYNLGHNLNGQDACASPRNASRPRCGSLVKRV